MPIAHFPSLLIWTISLASILCMLLRPRRIAEAYWACGGAILLVLSRLPPLSQAVRALREGLDVYLFLAGMMILAEIAREECVFEWIADVAALHSRNSSSRLFVLIYLVGTVVTVFFPTMPPPSSSLRQSWRLSAGPGWIPNLICWPARSLPMPPVLFSPFRIRPILSSLTNTCRRCSCGCARIPGDRFHRCCDREAVRLSY